ncbi:helix-turn-helix transcriptional regulator [Rhodococcus fascians]|nr:helix-turn-helix transcriptional regulator [Rhodococcus fascians]MBY4237973.1 helix-turn-helix transcriptional regulator [Rhodococcus fascians]MBY4253276.1 helix-turn-helix transcriptional regulator [Rhodococcus fascians]
MKVALSLAAGKSNTSIAGTHLISVNTVRFHVRNVVRKLEVGDRGYFALVLASGLTSCRTEQPTFPWPAAWNEWRERVAGPPGNAIDIYVSSSHYEWCTSLYSVLTAD